MTCPDRLYCPLITPLLLWLLYSLYIDSSLMPSAVALLSISSVKAMLPFCCCLLQLLFLFLRCLLPHFLKLPMHSSAACNSLKMYLLFHYWLVVNSFCITCIGHDWWFQPKTLQGTPDKNTLTAYPCVTSVTRGFFDQYAESGKGTTMLLQSPHVRHCPKHASPETEKEKLFTYPFLIYILTVYSCIQGGQCILFSIIFTPFTPSHHEHYSSMWVLPVIFQLSLFNHQCIADGGLPITYDGRGFVGPKKKTIFGLLVFNPLWLHHFESASRLLCS